MQRIILICILIGIVSAVNVTVFKPPPGLVGHLKRDNTFAIASAIAETYWRISLYCRLEWSYVQTIADELPYQLAGCYLEKIGQATARQWTTLLRVQCVIDVGDPETFADILLNRMRMLLLNNVATSHCVSGDMFSIARDSAVRVNVSAINIQTPAPWDLDRLDKLPTNSYDNMLRYQYTGAGVTIYSIDTGVRTSHQEFGGRATNILNLVNPPYLGDDNGHGTGTLSKAGGVTFGLAKTATLAGIKALDSNGNGYLSDVIIGIMEVADRQAAAAHPAVLYMSLAGPADNMLDSYTNSLATEWNVPVVVAAGNDAEDAKFYSPCRAAQPLCVGASTYSDVIAWFSNYGPSVDIVAPGEGVLVADKNTDLHVSVESGTSFSAPLVAGFVAQLIEAHNLSYTASAIRSLVLQQATLPGSIRVNGFPLLYTGYNLSLIHI